MQITNKILQDRNTYGSGMTIETSFNSMWSCSNSYSIFTSHPPSIFSDGQQLTKIILKGNFYFFLSLRSKLHVFKIKFFTC